MNVLRSTLNKEPSSIKHKPFFSTWLLSFPYFQPFFNPYVQATFMVRLPPLGLALFHLYDSLDSPMTLRSDTLLRLSGRGATARAADPLPVRSQQSDSRTFYISSQSLTLGFSGTTGLLEVCLFMCSYILLL